MPTRGEILDQARSGFQMMVALCNVGVQLETMGDCVAKALKDITDVLPDIGHTQETKSLNLLGVPKKEQELLAETFRRASEQLAIMLDLVYRFGFDPNNNILMITPKQEEG